MNKKIIEQFELLVYQTQMNSIKNENSWYDNVPNSKQSKFKLIAYRKALEALRTIEFEIKSIEDVKHIQNLGKSSLDKINEILTTGVCSAIKTNTTSSKNIKKIKELKELQRITGIGPAKAAKLFNDGGHTLESLLEMQEEGDDSLTDILTHHQLLGLKYLYDIEKRIPHKEIKCIETYLNKIAKDIDRDLQIVICGSYRRLAQTSGDIDVIFYHNQINGEKDLLNAKNYLENIIKDLKKVRFLVDDLTIKGKTKYMGLCRLNSGPARRIDIRFVPKDVLGSAMLYFTGSGDFNKNMRSFALKKGYTINEYGIYYSKDNKKIPTKTEDDIFRTLGLEYVKPSDRKSEYIFK